LKQDLLFFTLDRSKLIKVKVLSVDSLIASADSQSMQSCLKILFNFLERPNPDVLLLLQEMNESYTVTDHELDMLLGILKEG